MVARAERRLRVLERRLPGSELGAVIVVYDAATGQPGQPVPPGARVQVWIPSNGRDGAASGREPDKT